MAIRRRSRIQEATRGYLLFFGATDVLIACIHHRMILHENNDINILFFLRARTCPCNDKNTIVCSQRPTYSSQDTTLHIIIGIEHEIK